MSHLQQETSPSLAKKYVSQVSQLRELAPDWNDDDLLSVLQDTNGSVEVAFDRISQGLVQQWGAVSRKNKKPQPAGRDSPRGGRGQRGRGASRGGHRGGSSQRGSHSRAAPATPVNGTGSDPSSSQAPDVAAAPPTPTPAPAQTVAEPKPNGTPVPAVTPAPTSNGTPHHAPTPPTQPAPASAAPPVKSWASLLKPKPAPAPAPAPPKKQPSAPASAPSLASQPQAPPTTATVAPEHPDDIPLAQADVRHEPESEELDVEPEVEPEPEVVEELAPVSEPVFEPPPPVEEPAPPVREQPKPEPPAPALAQAISPPTQAPLHHAPPGLNLVTQQAPAPEPAQVAQALPRQVAPVPAPVAQKPVVQHRPSARYPKSDQAVVMPSGFGDLVTGMGGLSFGQFGDPEASPEDTQSPPEQPQSQVHIPPTVNIPTEAPAPSQVPVQPPPQEQPVVHPHLNISDQLPQAQDVRPIPTQPQHNQTPLLSHLPQTSQQVAPSVQSHFSPPVQTQPTPQSHFPAQIQAHLPQHQSVASTQSPHIQNAQQQHQQQQEQQQPLHTSHLVHTQVHEPFPQHALSGVNLYQQSSQSPFGQQPQQPQQPQQLHPGLRQSHLAQQQQQQQQQISPPAQQTQQPMLGGLGSHYQQPHLELGVGSEYGAFGNLGQPAAAANFAAPDRYGYDNSHSHQGGFYDAPYGIPTRGASTSDDISKGSPSQQQSAPISQNTAPSQPQPQQQQQQPNQSGQQQPYSGIAPMPYFYAPYYQNQYFGQPSPNYGQPFVKYPPMYPQQSQQQQSQQQPQQAQQPQQQPPQPKAAGSLYEDQYGQGGYQPQPQQTAGSDYVKTQQQQQFGAQGSGLQSLLGSQARAPVTSDMGLKGYGTAADKSRVGQQQQQPYYANSMRYPQHVPHQQGYQQQQPDNNYYSYANRQPQQPNQNYGQWQ
ncbi:RNAPII degradation factor [Ceratobasidium sp. 428]|nr:RNAPII degradation factor [Ceratobasidium sp. 428]